MRGRKGRALIKIQLRFMSPCYHNKSGVIKGKLTLTNKQYGKQTEQQQPKKVISSLSFLIKICFWVARYVTNGRRVATRSEGRIYMEL